MKGAARWAAPFSTGASPSTLPNRAMHPSALIVENIRSYKRRSTLRIRPLTLVFGSNSAGKSTLVRTIAAIASTNYQPATNRCLIDMTPFRGASVDDVISRRSPYEPFLSVGLSWSTDDGATVRIDQKIRRMNETGPPVTVVDEILIEDNGSASRFQWVPNPEFAPTFRSESGRSVRLRNTGPFLVPKSFKKLEKPIRDLRAHEWVDSIRDAPPRAFVPTDLVQQHPRGSSYYHRLALDHYQGGRVLEQVSAWLERATSLSLSIQQFPVPRSAPQSLYEVSSLGEPSTSSNLVDTGEGICQVVPVLTALAFFKQSDSSLLSVEHPTLHLHPRAHVHLANALVDVARERHQSGALIVETHSPVLLLALQLAVARGQCDPAWISVAWIRSDSSGETHVDNLDIDRSGVVEGLPVSAFREETELARELLSARNRTPSR